MVIPDIKVSPCNQGDTLYIIKFRVVSPRTEIIVGDLPVLAPIKIYLKARFYL
jgi:hypothetical protein